MGTLKTIAATCVLFALIASTARGADVQCLTEASPVLGSAVVGEFTLEATPGGVVRRSAGGDLRVFTACDGLPGTAATAVAPFQGAAVVALRGKGLRVLEPGSGAIKALAVDEPALSWVTALWPAQDGGLWVGTVQHGLWRVDSEGQRAWQPEERLSKGRVTGLTGAGRGGVYVGRDLRGLWHVAAAGGARRVLTGSVQGVRTHHGATVVSLGAVECDLEKSRCVRHRVVKAAPPTAAHGLPSAHITSLAVTGGTRPALLVGTFDRGVAHIADSGAVERLPQSPAMVNQLVAAENGAWAATPSGLYHQAPSGTWRRYGEASGLPSDRINAVSIDAEGVLWVSTSQGAARWSPAGILPLPPGGPHRIVHAAHAQDGRLLAATAYGLGAFDAVSGQWRHWRRGQGGLSDDWVQAVAPLEPGTWLVGTYDAGVDLLRGDTLEHVEALGAVWVNPNGIIHLPELSLTAVATLGDGLFLLDAAGGFRQWKVSGLPSDDVTSAAVFGGRLWIGTRSGLASWSADPAQWPPAERQGSWRSEQLGAKQAASIAARVENQTPRAEQ